MTADRIEPGSTVAAKYGVTIPQLQAHIRAVENGDAKCAHCEAPLLPTVTARRGKYCDVNCRNAHHRATKGDES